MGFAALRGRARSSGGRFPTARFTAGKEHPGQVSLLAAHLHRQHQLHGQDGREGVCLDDDVFSTARSSGTRTRAPLAP